MTRQRLLTLFVAVTTLLPVLPVQGQETCKLYLNDTTSVQLEAFVRNYRDPSNPWNSIFQHHDTYQDGQIFERIDNRPRETEDSREAALWHQCSRLPSDAVIMTHGVTFEGDPVCAVKLSEEGKRLLIAPGANGPMMLVSHYANSYTPQLRIAQPSKLLDGTDGYALTIPRSDFELSQRDEQGNVYFSQFSCSVPDYFTVQDGPGTEVTRFVSHPSVSGNICDCPRGFLDVLNNSGKASWFSVVSSTEDLSGVCSGGGCLTAYQGISELQFASHQSRESFYVDSIQFTQRPSLGLWFPSTSNLHNPFSGCFSQELKYTPLSSRITFSNDDKKALLHEAEYYYTLSQLVTAKKALSKHINSTIVATQLTESDVFDPFENAESYEMVDAAYQLWLASRPKSSEDQSAALAQLNSTFVALMQSIELNSAIKDLQEIVFDFSSFRRTPTPAVLAWGRYMNKTFPEGAIEPVDWYEVLFLGACPAPYKCGGTMRDAGIALARAITDKQAIVAKHFNSLPWIAQIQDDGRFKAGELIPRNEVKRLSLNYLKRYLRSGYPEDRRLLDDYEELEAYLKCPTRPARLWRPLEELILSLPPRLPLTETILPESEAARMTTLCQQGDVNACAQRDYLKKRYAVERVFESIRFRRNTLAIKDQVNKSIEATGRVAVVAIAGSFLSAGMVMVAPRAISAVVEGTGLARGLSNVAAVGRSLGWTAEKNVILLKGLALAGYGSTAYGAANAIYQSVSECDELAKSVTNDDNQSLKEYFSCVEAKQTEVANILMPAIGLKRLTAGLCGGISVLPKSRLKKGSNLTAKAGRVSGACGLVTTSASAAARVKLPQGPRAFLQAVAGRLTLSSSERSKLLRMVREGIFRLPALAREAERTLGGRISNANGTYYWDSSSDKDQIAAKLALKYIDSGALDEAPQTANRVAEFLKRRLSDLTNAKVVPGTGTQGLNIEKPELLSPRNSPTFDSIYVQQSIALKIDQQVTGATGTIKRRYTYTLRWHTKDPSAVGVNSHEAYYKIERSYEEIPGRISTTVRETFVPEQIGAGTRGTWMSDSAGGRNSAAAHIKAELEDLVL